MVFFSLLSSFPSHSFPTGFQCSSYLHSISRFVPFFSPLVPLNLTVPHILGFVSPFHVTWQPHLSTSSVPTPLICSAADRLSPPTSSPASHFLISPGDNLTSPFPVAPQCQFPKLRSWFHVLEDTHRNVLVLSLNPVSVCVSNQTSSTKLNTVCTQWRHAASS